MNEDAPSMSNVFSNLRWCREQDLNLHAFWALDPKSNASANSAIPALAIILI
jgi:hypothetical protein